MVGEKKVDYVGWFDPTVPLSSKQDSWWGHAPDTDFLVYTWGCEQPQAGHGVVSPGVVKLPGAVHPATRTIR